MGDQSQVMVVMETSKPDLVGDGPSPLGPSALGAVPPYMMTCVMEALKSLLDWDPFDHITEISGPSAPTLEPDLPF